MTLYLCGIVVILISIYKYFTWTFDHWQRLNVPYEPPKVFLGNMTFLFRENMSDRLRKLYKKYEHHDYFGMWLFRTPTLVVRSPKVTKEILVTKFNHFRDRMLATNESSDPLGANTLFIVKGTKWVQLRQRMSPAFTRAKVKNIFQLRMPSSISELLDYIDSKHALKKKPASMKDLFMRFTVEIITASVFGLKADCIRNKDAPFFKFAMTFVEPSFLRSVQLMMIFFIPSLAKFFGFKFFSKENDKYVRSIFKKVLATREKDILDSKEENKHNRDFVDILITMKNEDSAIEFTEDEILAQAGGTFFAGFDTTATTLMFLAYELAFNPDVQERLYEILNEMQIGKQQMDLDKLDDIKLLDRCIKETLRKYPVLPFLDRICEADCTLSDGLVVKKGTTVMVCTTGLHYDENYYPDPERWNPDRFLNESSLVPYTYLPFGEGPRICVGLKFATLAMKWTIASLLMKFRIEPCKETILPKDLRLSPYAVVNTTDSPLYLQFVRR